MTKRFTIENSNIVEDGYFIKDNTGSFSFPTIKDKSDLIMYEKHLNELADENEELKQELKEFTDFVYSDEKILCYTCVNCLSKGIYQIECSEKGKVDVHGTCFAYWKNEVM